MKRKKHLSLEERNIIERLVQEGKSNKAIAEALGTINIDDWARAGAELLAIEVQDVSK